MLCRNQVVPLPSGYTYMLTLLVMYICLSFMRFQLLLYLSTYTPRQVDYLLLLIVVVNLVHLVMLNLTTSLTLNYLSSSSPTQFLHLSPFLQLFDLA